MKNTWSWLALAFGLVVAVGCTAKEATKDGAAGGNNTPVASNTSGDSNAPSGTNEGAPSEGSVSMPADLIGSGVKYLGWEKGSVRTYSVVEGTEKPTEMTETVRITGIEDGVAKVSVTRTGGGRMAGADEQYEVRKDGIFNTMVANGELEKPALMFKRDIKVGDTWNEETSLSQNNQKISLKMSFTVPGTEKITIAGTQHDAIKVIGDGTISIAPKDKPAQVSKTKTTTWYVDGMGAVKLQITSDTENMKNVLITLQKSEEYKP